MDLVALVALNTPVEVEAPLLAAEIGSTAYETALLLRAPSPVVVLRTEDRTRAMAVLGGLRSRGHEAIACDVAAIATGGALTHVKGFALAPETLSITSADGRTEPMPWDTPLAIVRAVHRVRSESVEKTSTQKFDLGRAAMTGGLMVTKKTTTTTKHSLDEREPVLYVFRRGASPLLFRQSSLRWDGLGARLRPLAHENFQTLLRMLREHTPRVPYDERLSTPRPADFRERAGANGSSSSSTSDGVAELAHVVALAISRATPYRV